MRIPSFMSYFGGRRDPKATARDSIITLRQQLQLLEKKEEVTQKKIDDDTAKARANAVSNKQVATAALRRKKQAEKELDLLAGQRLQLEMTVNALESANLNQETLAAMTKGRDALASIQRNLTPDKVEDTMASITEQRQMANDISSAMANPLDMEDESDLQEELAALEQDVLDERLTGATHVPLHTPASPTRQAIHQTAVEEDDEAEELRKLQAEMAM